MSKNAFFFSHLKSADSETCCDWSTSSWRNNLNTPWYNNLVYNSLDDVITLWRDVKIVTPQGNVLFTAFWKLMFEYIFWYEVSQWFLNDIAQKFWKMMDFQNIINSHDVQLVNRLVSRGRRQNGPVLIVSSGQEELSRRVACESFCLKLLDRIFLNLCVPIFWWNLIFLFKCTMPLWPGAGLPFIRGSRAWGGGERRRLASRQTIS